MGHARAPEEKSLEGKDEAASVDDARTSPGTGSAGSAPSHAKSVDGVPSDAKLDEGKRVDVDIEIVNEEQEATVEKNVEIAVATTPAGGIVAALKSSPTPPVPKGAAPKKKQKGPPSGSGAPPAKAATA